MREPEQVAEEPGPLLGELLAAHQLVHQAGAFVWRVVGEEGAHRFGRGDEPGGVERRPAQERGVRGRRRVGDPERFLLRPEHFVHEGAADQPPDRGRRLVPRQPAGGGDGPARLLTGRLALGGDAVRAVGQPVLDLLLAFLLVGCRLSGGRLAERCDTDSGGEKRREGHAKRAGHTRATSPNRPFYGGSPRLANARRNRRGAGLARGDASCSNPSID